MSPANIHALLRSDGGDTIPLGAKPLADKLEHGGFICAPWLFKGAFLTFERGTMDGLIQVDMGELRLIAINNNRPGNGQFKKLMDDMEDAADALKLTLIVCEIWNDRLADHLKAKRGYALVRKHGGRCAERMTDA